MPELDLLPGRLSIGVDCAIRLLVKRARCSVGGCGRTERVPPSAVAANSSPFAVPSLASDSVWLGETVGVATGTGEGVGATGGPSGAKLVNGESEAGSGNSIGGSFGVFGSELNGSDSDISAKTQKRRKQISPSLRI